MILNRLSCFFRQYQTIIVIFFMTFFAAGKLQAQIGRLTVTSRPPGAYIWLDDQEIGTTPIYNRDIKTGYYTLKLVDPVTKVEKSQSVQIIVDSLVSLNFDNGGSTGFISVTSTPKGAEVALVTILGKTPIDNYKINADDYAVTIKHPKQLYSEVTENITIEDNRLNSIDTSLPKNKTYIWKSSSRIFLGATSIGCYSWGFYSLKNDNNVGSVVGFALGTLLLVGVEVLSF